MTNKAYELIQLVLNYGYVNFKGGSDTIDWDTYTRRDEDLYEKICKAVKELDEGGKSHD